MPDPNIFLSSSVSSSKELKEVEPSYVHPTLDGLGFILKGIESLTDKAESNVEKILGFILKGIES